MSEDQSNDSPPPKPSISDMWARMNQRIDNALPRTIAGDDATLPPELTQQEEMIQYSARKLATMANEIKDIVETGGAKSDVDSEFFVDVLQGPYDKGRIGIVAYLRDDIRSSNGDNATIEFRYSPDAQTDYGKKLGTSGNFELTVGIHNDEQSREIFDEYAKREPKLTRYAYPHTRYYFDEEGNCAKVLGLPVGMSDSRPLLEPANQYVKSVQGEMAPSDFELAGKALNVILEKIRPQAPQTV